MLYSPEKAMKVIFDNACVIEDDSGFLVMLYENVKGVLKLRDMRHNIRSFRIACGIVRSHELSSMVTIMQAEDIIETLRFIDQRMVDTTRNLPRRPRRYDR